jgi:tRNA G10  N-methylase Trm11
MYVKSISHNQHQIIKWILKLHCETDIELDPTYSVGGFYKQGVKEPKFKFDLMPARPGVVKAAAEALPLKDSSISTMIFDPPFLATKGKSLDGPLDDAQNKTVRRFGWYPTEKELFCFYRTALQEFRRVLKPGGILIFKCQDKVSSGKQYMSHNFIINEAEKWGFYTKDLFVLLAKNRMIPRWQTLNQKHARKFHSYFLVFENQSRRRVTYVK